MAAKTKTEQETVVAEHATKARDARSGGWWSDLPEHHRVAYAGLIVTVFSVIGAIGLAERANPTSALAPIGIALYNLAGWCAYPLVLGLVAAGVLRIAEGIARRPLAPRWLPVQVLVLLLVLVALSRLVLGGNAGGLLGLLLALVLSGLPVALAIGLLIAAALLLSLAVLSVRPGGVFGLVRRLAVGAYRDLGGPRTGRRIQTFQPPSGNRFPDDFLAGPPRGADPPKPTEKPAPRHDSEDDDE